MGLQKLEFHELANEFPLIEGEELQKIAEGIKHNGFLLEPITLLDGKVLDGRNRYNAAKQAGYALKPEDVEQFAERYPGQDPVEFVIAKNLHRRHLTEDQRAMIAAKLYAKLPKEKAGGDRTSSLPIGKNEKLPSAQSQKQKVATQMKVSVKKVDRAAAIQKKDAAKAAQVQAGATKMVQAEKELKRKKVAFDEAGVGQYVKDKKVLNWFRKVSERYSVPLAKQAKIAALLLNEAVEHNKGRLSLPFAKDFEKYIPSALKHDTTQQIDEQTGVQIEAEAAHEQWKREAEEFRRHVGGMLRSGYAMTGLAQKYPQIDFVINNELRRSIKHAKQVIDKLAELKPISWWRSDPEE
jgi:hypothetical protein